MPEPEPKPLPHELGEMLYREFRLSVKAAVGSEPLTAAESAGAKGRLLLAYRTRYSDLGICQQAWIELARRLYAPQGTTEPD